MDHPLIHLGFIQHNIQTHIHPFESIYPTCPNATSMGNGVVHFLGEGKENKKTDTNCVSPIQQEMVLWDCLATVPEKCTILWRVCHHTQD